MRRAERRDLGSVEVRGRVSVRVGGRFRFRVRVRVRVRLRVRVTWCALF